MIKVILGQEDEPDLREVEGLKEMLDQKDLRESLADIYQHTTGLRQYLHGYSKIYPTLGVHPPFFLLFITYIGGLHHLIIILLD